MFLGLMTNFSSVTWNCGNQLSLIDHSEELLAVEPRKVQALFCSMDETN